jgi:orotate phosphoribosyltransferase
LLLGYWFKYYPSHHNNKSAEAVGGGDAMALERSRLLEILKRTSYRESVTPIYHLASGIDSKYYIDCKYALSDPEARDCLATIVVKMFSHTAMDAIGGLELGAYPIATSISDRIYKDTGKKIRVFVVRKEQKKHGNTSLIAGDARRGDRVLIVDDVITSGGSAIKAIDAARDAGLKVDRVVAMVDREDSKNKVPKPDQKRTLRRQSSRVAAAS